jgi:methylmalonyl-CoA/ethylmalonyl-CoA epimerase
MPGTAKLFHHLHHVCIVVRDLVATQAYLESVGIGPWRDYPPLTDYVALATPSPGAFHAMAYRVCDLENVQIQLCQPPADDCPQRRFLDQHGEGVFHLGFSVPDCDAADAEGRTLGLDVLMSGRRTDRSGFTYFDTADEAGVVLEIRQSPANAQ